MININQHVFIQVWIISFIICSMLSKYATTKPLYSFQRGLTYQKHKRKLIEIQSKSPNTNSSKSVEIRPWAKQKLKIQLQKQSKQIQQENEKLLFKLMKISTRNSLKSNQLKQHRDNPYRKNWLMNIKRQNQDLGEKLINLRSSLQYSRFSKSICEYEKVKKSMMVNRRARLPQLSLKLNEADNIKKKMKTQPNFQQGMTKTIKTQKIDTVNHDNYQERDTKTQLEIKVFQVQNDNLEEKIQQSK